MTKLTFRPRRLRVNPAMRELTAETHLHRSDFIYPMFVAEGIDAPQEISSMPGQYQHTLDSLVKAVEEAANAGVLCVDLFGVPVSKDAVGSQAWAEVGILNKGIARLRKEFGDDVLVMADTCLDEFTDHGHCGVVTEDGRVDNDPTVALYQNGRVPGPLRSTHG